MKHFTQKLQSARQGEAYFIRTKFLPENVKQVIPVEGKYVIAHSENGSHHVIEAHHNVEYFTSDNSLVSYLQVIEATDQAETLLKHLRGFDTHDTIKFDAGIYCVVTGRESSPEGWRKVTD